MRALLACVSLLALSGSSAGCMIPAGGNDCVCTLEYRYITVKVVDGAGAPVNGLAPTLTLVRTGQVFTPKGNNFGNTYVVLTDGDAGLIRPDGDVIHFAASNSAGSVQADFTIGLTTPCDCHVLRMSGPEQIVLQ